MLELMTMLFIVRRLSSGSGIFRDCWIMWWQQEASVCVMVGRGYYSSYI
jgi:hypothetical protein